MTQVTAKVLQERLQQSGLHICEDNLVDGRKVAALVRVPASDWSAFELAVAVLLELSMVIVVEKGQILVDDDPFTWEEVIETADELLADYAE